MVNFRTLIATGIRKTRQEMGTYIYSQNIVMSLLILDKGEMDSTDKWSVVRVHLLKNSPCRWVARGVGQLALEVCVVKIVHGKQVPLPILGPLGTILPGKRPGTVPVIDPGLLDVVGRECEVRHVFDGGLIWIVEAGYDWNFAFSATTVMVTADSRDIHPSEVLCGSGFRDIELRSSHSCARESEREQRCEEPHCEWELTHRRNREGVDVSRRR